MDLMIWTLSVTLSMFEVVLNATLLFASFTKSSTCNVIILPKNITVDRSNNIEDMIFIQ